jgi:membrane protein
VDKTPLTKLKNWIIDFSDKLIAWARVVTLPFFDRVPLYDVGVFFWKGLVDGAISTRASAIAFNFILALFPAIIFFFTLIPYIPIENFQKQLLDLFASVMPSNAYLAIEETIKDIVMQPRGGLLSFGFLAAFYFSTNGIVAIITAFNGTIHSIETRSWLNQHLVALRLAVVLITLTTISIAMITISKSVLDFFVAQGLLHLNSTYLLLIQAGKWLIICILFYFSYAFLFYYAPARKTKFRFFSAGVTLTTILSIVTSVGFSYYINNFGKYNTLYGSIGTLIVVMLSIYFNSLMLIIGFELNTSIWIARKRNKQLKYKRNLT